MVEQVAACGGLVGVFAERLVIQGHTGHEGDRGQLPLANHQVKDWEGKGMVVSNGQQKQEQKCA